MTANDHATCASFYRHRAVERIKQIIRIRRHHATHAVGTMELESDGRVIEMLIAQAAADMRQASRDEAAAMQRRAA